MAGNSVGIIGGGIAGLSAARYLASEGFEPTVLEAFDEIGGQWNRKNPVSGVWPTMRTNTSNFVTKLSDVQYPADTKIFPFNWQVLDMIEDMIDTNGLRNGIRCGCKVRRLERDGGGYRVTWVQAGETYQQAFDRVVVATGRFTQPVMPEIDGLDGFTGAGGVTHSHHYKDPLVFRDMNIVVLGGSISSMEVASDQSLMGTGRVYLSQRRQRYVMPKMINGVPLEFYAFTLEGAEAARTAAPQDLLDGAKEFLEVMGGNPQRFGAPRPHDDMAKAGVTGSQHFLNLVAEDRIDVRPWVEKVEGDLVTFADGTTVQADAIIVGTGFRLDLPFLSEEIAGTVKLTASGLDLMEFTYHPDLPGLAFMGLWAQLGPYPVVLEQQARWIAYGWSGRGQMPDEAAQRVGVAACIAEKHHDGYREQHEMATRFARLAGTMPNPGGDRELAAILPKCPVTGEMFRVSGPDARSDAAEWIKKNFWFYAPIPLKRQLAAELGLSETGTGELAAE